MDSSAASGTRTLEGPSRRRARRRRPSLGARLPYPSPTVLLGALLLGSVLAIGTVHRLTLLGVAAIALAAVAVARAAGRWAPGPAVLLALALASYSLLQSLPLPLEVLQTLSPGSADTWARALLPFGEDVRWGSLSIDRGASLVEALKWITYAAVFGLSASVGRERGAIVIAGLLFFTAFVLALVTLAHGLVDAQRVFGFYQPSFTPTRWVTSPLLNPNNLAGYLVLGTFAGLALLVSSRTPWPRWALAVGTALLVGQTVLTASRGGVLALLLGCVAVILVVPRVGSGRVGGSQSGGSRRGGRTPRRSFWSWPVVCALAGGLLLGLVGAQQTTWEDLRQEGSDKLAIVGWVVPMIADHPWFGVGAGAFETAFPAYRAVGGSVWAHPENFVLAWVSEWGIPVGAAALLGLCWMFRPARIGAHRSRLAATLTIGIVMVSLQNLVDLGFSLPGVFIAVAAALGGLRGAWQAETAQGDAVPSSVEGPPLAESPGEGRLPRASALAWLILGAGATALLLVALWGRHSALADREELAQLHRSTSFTDPAASAAFRERLRAAMLRHPGEAFFARLGALAAWRTPGASPLPWITRALERDMMSGRMHLLLAEVLAHRGGRAQAMLHLRLAAEREPALADPIARLALAWAERPQDVYRAVPEHDGGAELLTRLALALRPRDPADAPWRRRFLEEALARDEHLATARVTLIRDLLGELVAAQGPCGASPEACVERVQGQLARLRETDPANRHLIELEGSLIAARGDRDAAIAFLLERCERRDAPCLRRAVELSAATDELPLDGPSQAYVAAACRSAAACGAARTWLGDLHARRQLWGAALAHYTRAAEALQTSAAWLRVADAASRQGTHSRALAALRRAESRLRPGDSSAAAQVATRRREVLGRMGRAAPGAATP